MFTNFPFFPHEASAHAAQVDAIYFFMVSVTAFFSLLIAGLLVFFAIKYHRRHDDEVGASIHGSLALELLWTVIPFFITMVMFGWGAKVFFDAYRPPKGAMEIYIVGKQWMWKAQHMDGQRALVYSRVRKNLLNPGDSDITRGERNQQVLQALMSKLASFDTYMRLPFIGDDLTKPLATDMSANDFAALGWSKFRGRTIHCRLGGTSTGGDITPSEDNAKVILMVLGRSAVQPPAPSGVNPRMPAADIANWTSQ